MLKTPRPNVPGVENPRLNVPEVENPRLEMPEVENPRLEKADVFQTNRIINSSVFPEIANTGG